MTADALLSRWQTVKSHIRQTAERYNRDPDSIKLLAVSKFHPNTAIATLAQAGQVDFGENYVQEMLEKAATLADLGINWHFIGPLQSNKCKEVAMTAHTMHSLDRIKLVAPLAVHRPADLARLKVLLQVNIDDEASKSGVTGFADLLILAKAVVAQERLSLCGLMTIPKPSTDIDAQRLPFAQLRLLRDQLEQALGMALPDLSMGMSADLEAAIAEGATIVRVGTDVFGSRPIKTNN